jgi:hypothetical protein
MELLHDVIVEFQIAGSNFRNLQKYLANNMSVASLHSCYMLILAKDDLDSSYENCGIDQKRRTQLDWDSGTLKNIDINKLLTETEYSKREAEVAQQCYGLTEQMVNL